MPVEPPAILSNVPGSFPESVLRERHPAIVARVLDGIPYAPAVRHELERLLQEPVIEPLPAGAHDAADWARWGAGMYGRSWYDVPFLWAENFFYRRLLEATGYYGPGPWRGIDPFGPQKAADLPGAAELAELDALQDLQEDEQAAALTAAALWGNRADLGFRLVSGGSHRVDELVADDTKALWGLLRGGGTICLVADNAGRELLPDLVLIDFLLRTGRAGRVELHVKPAPYFVSDALPADVLDELRRFPPDSAVGRRLKAALRDGSLSLHADGFYCAPLTFHDAPQELASRFAAAELTILKGDLNYRRLVGDRHWPVTAPFDELTGYFPGAVAALRTVKSDVVVGLGAGAERSLPASWRTSGAFALVQVRG
ncbi:damage-control phosphatase ARMT1 family protein [Dactylosporangium sp. AC04546]|uniref:damage-control phosphatase ARMT1 family protein n=1 Tax=Dactylosporangium sp. AC04546 TaxID=2862460 RepID=UPI001EDE64C4|nr:damage-control phosphatase ARMT1 family protein [Dactylosporangium sp. AC04546]WVK81817.1 damage-control phosphatase ARMT1 family protein [Dactylosporangium sp. AC04546]